MTKHKVQPLLVNYKTLEEFKRFKEYGNQELAMLEDLESNIVENDSESPFFGVYFGNALAGRMSLYRVRAKYDHYFNPPQDYLELWKLEVLPDYRDQGFGKAMVDFAKSFNLPIKTNPRIKSHSFWEKMDFQKAHYDVGRDLGENPLIWMPSGVKEREV
ncbi:MULTISPECIES: N-acetyltransferase [Halobacillus]|uniref:N-acetyltransferase n=1 Tax=Halobacillus TaxID=45667 RepID=UPI0009A72D73|nr:MULTISPECIES: N-acetyltransferase [Halobacillus]